MKKTLIFSAIAFSPSLILAADPKDGLGGVLKTIGELLDGVYLLLIAGATIAFFWGLFKFIAGGDQGAEKAKGLMGWSIVALFVMVSVWGLVQILQSTLGVEGKEINAPALPTVGKKAVSNL